MNPHSTHEELSVEGLTDAERSEMKEHDIAFDGRHFYFSGYRYSKLGDALNYARLVRERPELPSRGHAVAADRTASAPSQAARERMDSLGIALVAGTYRLGEFRYDRLEDALAYAEQVARRHDRPRETP